MMRLKGCTALPQQGRRVKRGFTEEDTSVIGGNFLRVCREVSG